MKSVLLAFGIAIGLGAGMPFANAQYVTLSQAVDAAWQRTIDSQESSGQVRRAGAELEVARSFWSAAPTLEIGHRDDRLQSNRGAKETELGIALPLWRPGQRGARLDAAQADRDAAEASIAAGRLRTAGAVREAAWSIAIQRAELEVSKARQSALRSLSADVGRRVDAGELARADGLAARAEMLGAQAAVLAAEQQLQAATQEWSVLTGLTAILEPTLEPDVIGPEEHPALRFARLHVEAAQRRLKAVSASSTASPELIARVRQDTSGRAEASSHSLGLAVRIPLGASKRNAPLVEAAMSELNVAEAAERQFKDRQQAALTTARLTEANAQRQLKDDRNRAALLSERAQLMERAFAAGEGALPETLRALSAAQDAAAAAKRQEAAVGLARAKVLQALGVTP
ncbi:MAG: TolC family protein [Delftia sp.]|nr:TolC family protein [Delftia sp.]MPT54928.1 TolC family protein [Delftia sp.]SFB66057.1 Outer membrane protein TolC [Delftia tsuruhatensis]